MIQLPLKAQNLTYISHQQINLDDESDIEALQVMFPATSEEHLCEVRGNNITMQETIDEILGKSEGVECEGI